MKEIASRLDMSRYPTKVLFDLLAEGRWVPQSRIKEALTIRPDNNSMFAYNQINREVSRLRQAFRRAHINNIVVARHEIDEPGFVMFEAPL
jgi:hypothetical protein